MNSFSPQGFAEKWAHTKRILQTAADRYSALVFANSLGAEDVVLTDLIWTDFPQIDIFTLDTGRLHPANHDLMASLEVRYGRRLTVYSPLADATQSLVSDQGINGFYDSIDNRKSCCYVRKVEPLKRALAGRDAWITGLRRSQSVTRLEIPEIGPDPAFDLDKVNPLLAWSNEDVWHAIRTRDIPYNALHDKGYPSIGCAPCTRPIAKGEDIRAGRWWWENPETRECGLHRHQEVA